MNIRKEILGYDSTNVRIIILFTMLLVAGTYVSYVHLLTFIMALGCFVVLEQKESFGCLLFLLPFAQVFKLTPYSSSLFTYLLIALSLINLFRQRIIRRGMLTSLLVLSLYMYLGMGNDYTIYIKILFSLLLLYQFVQSYHDEFPDMLMMFSAGMLITSAIGWHKENNPRLAQYFGDFNQDFVTGHGVIYRFSGLYEDPNYYSIGAVIVILGCILVILNGEKNTAIPIVCAIIQAVLGCFTYSKIYIVGLVLCIVLVLKEFFNNRRTILYSVLGIPAISGIGYWWATRSGFIVAIKSRFMASDVSNGRTRIWQQYLDYLSNSFKTIMFGDGVGASYYLGVGPHNTYIEFIYFLGIIGSFLYLVALANALRSSYPSQNKLVNYAGVLIFVIMIGTLGVLKTGDFVFYIMLVWMMTKYKIKNQIDITPNKGAIVHENY